MANASACAVRTAELYAFLQENLEGNTQVSLCLRCPDSCCLKVTIPTQEAENQEWNYDLNCPETKDVEFNQILIYVSPTVMENRYGEPIYKFEIGLINKSDKLVYVSSIGYDDICCFYTFDDLLEEILRLAEL